MKFFLFLIFCTQAHAQSICLNMIVKNEKHVIERCLESVKPFIDSWIIVDTGSTDGTQEVIREFLKDIPGKLYERPWVNFGYNRNEAMLLAKGWGDFLLFIDADEELVVGPGFSFPFLDKAAYFINSNLGELQYQRVQIVDNRIDWKWEGVLHEYLIPPFSCEGKVLQGIENKVRFDGARSKDPNKSKRDIELLEKTLEEDPSDARNTFYLAQTYAADGQHEKAIKAYQKRVEMGGWDQEVYWSLYQIAELQEKLDEPFETVVSSYHLAYSYRPSRIESLFSLAIYLRSKGYPLLAYTTIKEGLNFKKTEDIVFVKQWLYEYGYLFEYAVLAYELKKYKEAIEGMREVLWIPNLPNKIQIHARSNVVKMLARLNEAQTGVPFDFNSLNPNAYPFPLEAR